MAGKNLGSASYKLALDASQWKEGAVLTRKETALLKQAWRETETPAEKLQRKIGEVEAAMSKLATGSDAAGISAKYLAKLRGEMEALNKTPAKGIGNLKGDMAGLGKDVAGNLPVVGRFTGMLGSMHPAAIAAAAGVAAIGAAAYGLKSAVASGLESIDNLGKAAERTGFDMQSFVGLDYAAGMSGIGNMSEALQTFTRGVGQLEMGGGKAKAAFDALGISSQEVANLAPIDQLKLVADRFANVESTAQQAAIAQKLFGGEGANMALLLQGGAAGLEDSINRAKELGLIVTDANSKAVQAANDAMSEIGLVGKGISMQLASELAPSLQTAATMLTDFLTSDQGKATVGLFIDAVNLGLKGVVLAAGEGASKLDKVVAGFLAGEMGARSLYAMLLEVRKGWNQLTGDDSEADAITAQIDGQRQAIAALSREFDSRASTSAVSYYQDFTAAVGENKAAHEAAAGARRDFAAAGGDMDADAESIDRLTKSVADYKAKLQEDLASNGKTGRAAEIDRLARGGATGTELQDIQALDRQLTERELAKTIAEQTAVYARQAEELAGVKRAKSELLAAQIAEYQALGATAQQLAGLRQAYQDIAAAERQAADKAAGDKAAKDAEKQKQAMDKVRQERERLFKDAATAVQGIDPEAKFRESVKEMLTWLDAGAISIDQFRKLKDEAAKSLEKPVKVNVSTVGIAAAAGGTMEALTRIDTLKAERAARGVQDVAVTRQSARANAIAADEANRMSRARAMAQSGNSQRDYSQEQTELLRRVADVLEGMGQNTLVVEEV